MGCKLQNCFSVHCFLRAEMHNSLSHAHMHTYTYVENWRRFSARPFQPVKSLPPHYSIQVIQQPTLHVWPQGPHSGPGGVPRGLLRPRGGSRHPHGAAAARVSAAHARAAPHRPLPRCRRAFSAPRRAGACGGCGESVGCDFGLWVGGCVCGSPPCGSAVPDGPTAPPYGRFPCRCVLPRPPFLPFLVCVCVFPHRFRVCVLCVRTLQHLLNGFRLCGETLSCEQPHSCVCGMFLCCPSVSFVPPPLLFEMDWPPPH